MSRVSSGSLAVNLASMIGDLRDRVANLRTYNQASDINHYCDELEIQVGLAHESAIKHLNEEHEQLLKEIRRYRTETLERSAVPAEIRTENKRRRLAYKESYDCFQNELNLLSTQIDSLNSEYSFYLRQEWSETETAEIVQEASELTRAIKHLSREMLKKMREQAFQKRFLSFKCNQLFTIQKDYLGTLSYAEEDENLKTPSKIIKETTPVTLPGHEDVLVTTRFRSNGLLISASRDRTLRLWDLQTKTPKRVVKLETMHFTEMIELLDGTIVTGHSDGKIMLWNSDFKVVLTFSGHNCFVFSMKELHNGNFASLSYDDTIKIWNPRLKSGKNLLFTMTGHCSDNRVYNQLHTLSNGYLVTFLRQDINSILKIWDPSRGCLVETIDSNIDSVITFTVLHNDEIVAASETGSLHLINLSDESLSRTILGPHSDRLCCFLLELPNKCVLFADSSNSESEFQVFDLQNGKIIQKILAGHKEKIHSCDISSDGRFTSASSLNSNIILLQLDL